MHVFVLRFEAISQGNHELRGEIVHYGTCFPEELKEVFAQMMDEFYKRNRS